jgi:hypothetical protein
MTEKPEACACCGHKTAELVYYAAEHWHKHKIEWLCGVCANTHLPGLFRNPTFEESNRAEIMRHITMCANLIIDAIKRT